MRSTTIPLWHVLTCAFSFLECPPKRMDGPAHGSSAHGHPMLHFPPGAVLLLAGFGVSLQQLLDAPLQGGLFPRWASWNGLWQHVSCFTPLLEVALDRCLRYLKTFDYLGTGYSLVNCPKNFLSHFLRICAHVSIISPGSIFLQVTEVNKVPLFDCITDSI